MSIYAFRDLNQNLKGCLMLMMALTLIHSYRRWEIGGCIDMCLFLFFWVGGGFTSGRKSEKQGEMNCICVRIR